MYTPTLPTKSVNPVFRQVIKLIHVVNGRSKGAYSTPFKNFHSMGSYPYKLTNWSSAEEVWFSYLMYATTISSGCNLDKIVAENVDHPIEKHARFTCINQNTM